VTSKRDVTVVSQKVKVKTTKEPKIFLTRQEWYRSSALSSAAHAVFVRLLLLLLLLLGCYSRLYRTL